MPAQVLIEQTPNGNGLPLPAYATDGSAAMDVLAAIAEDITIPPGQRALIPLGFRIAVPAGYEAQIRPRSGLALKNGITILNAPGTIDSDYRGEVGAIVHNAGHEMFTVTRGMRIAQMALCPVLRVALITGPLLDETARAGGGFGSTGTDITQGDAQ